MNHFFKRFFIISVVLIIIAGIFTWFWIFRAQDKSVENGKADLVMEAETLVNSFNSNEDQANKKYLNKIICVHGIVGQISEDEKEITVELKVENTSSGVSCSFDKSVLNKSSLKIGENVTIKGVCNGYLMDVVLNRCALVK